MNVCNRPQCQTTAGCAFRGPRGEMCWIAGDIPNPIQIHREGDCPYCQGTGKQMRWRTVGDDMVTVNPAPDASVPGIAPGTRTFTV